MHNILFIEVITKDFVRDNVEECNKHLCCITMDTLRNFVRDACQSCTEELLNTIYISDNAPC